MASLSNYQRDTVNPDVASVDVSGLVAGQFMLFFAQSKIDFEGTTPAPMFSQVGVTAINGNAAVNLAGYSLDFFGWFLIPMPVTIIGVVIVFVGGNPVLTGETHVIGSTFLSLAVAPTFTIDDIDIAGDIHYTVGPSAVTNGYHIMFYTDAVGGVHVHADAFTNGSFTWAGEGLNPALSYSFVGFVIEHTGRLCFPTLTALWPGTPAPPTMRPRQAPGIEERNP